MSHLKLSVAANRKVAPGGRPGEFRLIFPKGHMMKLMGKFGPYRGGGGGMANLCTLTFEKKLANCNSASCSFDLLTTEAVKTNCFIQN